MTNAYHWYVAPDKPPRLVEIVGKSVWVVDLERYLPLAKMTGHFIKLVEDPSQVIRGGQAENVDIDVSVK